MLSDVAGACLREITSREYGRLSQRFGEPLVGQGHRSGRPCELIVLAMGKFGGRELNYHSDLDIVFLYEAGGHTAGDSSGRTTNQHFFSELGQRIIKITSRLGANGRLYEVDARLRPTGRSGPLATSLGEFARYFAEGDGQLWERQALCKARVVYGSARVARTANAAVGKAAFEHRWNRAHANAIRQMRLRLQKTAVGGDLKRGPGGIVDIEFLVQMLQLRHGRRDRSIRRPDTISALTALHAAGHVSAGDHEFFRTSYRLLRTVESRLRLMDSNARDKLPDDPAELAKLARLLRYQSGNDLLDEMAQTTRKIRRRFDEIFDAEGL